MHKAVTGMADDVERFIRGRRRAVLAGAIAALRRSDAADLASTAHRLHGTLGTFGLGEAAAAVRDLEDALADPSRSARDRRVLWARTVDRLKRGLA